MAVRKKKKTGAKKRTARPKKAAKKVTTRKAARTTGKKTAKRTARKKAAKKATRSVTVKAPSQQAPRLPVAVQKRRSLLMKILLKKRNEVVKGLETQMGRKLVFDAGQKVDSAMDSADQSAQDVDAGIDYSLIEMKYEQYKDIADAFRKLQNNSYGLCEECGEEIAVKRLEVNPLARYCIACKTKKEEMEKIQREETRFKE
ncbi:MAG TPA: TraR/DksA family transcriptional regulator [Nitrospirota bacterium]|nr:TraR/DksA family transcriptional regulator [Nitrospirota bacterium]